MRALVLGGTGALGSRITARFQALGHEPTPVGRTVALTDASDVARHADGFDVVVNVAPAGTGIVQRGCDDAGVPSVDLNLAGRSSYPEDATGAAHIVGGGLNPGFSGLAAHALAKASGDRVVTIVLEQSSNADVGPAGVREMLRWVAGGRGPRPAGALPLAHPEASALALSDITAAYATRWDDPARQRLLAGLARLRLLGLVGALPDFVLRRTARHDPALPEVARLVLTAPSGARIEAESEGDYAGTAAMAVAFATKVGRLPAGLHLPWDVLELDDVRDDVADVVTVHGPAVSAR